MVPGWRRLSTHMNRAWAGRLEIEEIRQVTIAYAWTVPIAPICIIGAIIGLTLEFNGMGKIPSLFAWLVAAGYAGLAMVEFLVHHHKAQDLVARRLGLGRKAARKLDFRGYAKFDESTARAQRP